MTAQSVAVVGGTGRIGTEVVRLLRDADVSVRMLVRPASTASLPQGIHVLRGDQRQPPPEFLDGIDSLFIVSSDVDGERQLVRTAAAAGVNRVVKSSAVGYRDQAPAGHAAVEADIAERIPSWTVVRPNAFMQTLADYLPQLLDNNGVIRLPAGDGRTAWVDTEDIAALCAAVVLRPPPNPEVLTATGPQALDMHAVAAAFGSAMRRPIQYQPTNPSDALTALEQQVGPMAQFLIEHYTAVERGGFEQVSHDIEQVAGRPPRPLAAFLAERFG